MQNQKRIIVIKIGSNVILTRRNKLDEFRLNHIADQIILLQQAGYGVVLVVSGAVACGILPTNKSYSMKMWGNNVSKRAAAGIGQVYLISTLLKIFGQKGLKIAQILLTRDDFKIDHIRNNLLETLDFYFKSGIVPIFNENDVVNLNSFGGNDLLANEIAILLKASEVLILSTREGSTYGVGGGKSKLDVKKTLAGKNIKCEILNGKEKNILCYHVLKYSNMKFDLDRYV